MRWTTGIYVAGTPGVTLSTVTLLNRPTGIKLDNYLNMFVADTLNHRIQMFCYHHCWN